MKKTSGKYMFIGTPSRFGAGIKYSDTLQGLKLSKYDKEAIRKGESLLLTTKEDQIKRIYSNGRGL